MLLECQCFIFFTRKCDWHSIGVRPLRGVKEYDFEQTHLTGMPLYHTFHKEPSLASSGASEKYDIEQTHFTGMPMRDNIFSQGTVTDIPLAFMRCV